MDTNIIQHHFVLCTVKYTHVCIRHRVQTSLNMKEMGPPSAFESMKVVNTTFYAWEIQILNLLNRSRIENIIRAELNYEEHWHVLFLNKRTCRIVWFYGKPCRAKKPVEEDKKNILWTELVSSPPDTQCRKMVTEALKNRYISFPISSVRISGNSNLYWGSVCIYICQEDARMVKVLGYL